MSSIDTIGEPRMWTFTLPVRVDPRLAARMWAGLQRDLVRICGMFGVRVFEPHPGGHGLHVHVITGSYCPVFVVRDLCDRHGWGRCHVCRIPKDQAGYVAKYVHKSKRLKTWSGIRLWASFGAKLSDTFFPVKVKNVEVITASKTLYHELAEILKPKGFTQCRLLMRIAELSNHGLCTYEIIPATPEIVCGTVKSFRDGIPFDEPLIITAGRPSIRVSVVGGLPWKS